MISITSPKENVGKLAIFGWVAFVLLFHIGMTIDNLKEKETWRIKWKIQMTEGPIIRIVLKRLTELEISLRIQDKQIVKTIK